MAARWLHFKSRLTGTWLGDAAAQLRWTFGGLHRRRHPELWEVYLEERRLPLVLQRLLSRNSCCVDVGCHIGSFLNLLMQYAPNGQHIAFEPSIIKSTWLKSRFPHAEILPYAVAEKSGAAIFEEDIGRPGYSHLQGAPGAFTANTKNYEVKTCCLDDVLVGRNKIDLIKLDIEGGEQAALRGGKQTIKKFSPALIFECGSEYAFREQGTGHYRRQLYDFITDDLNYDVYCFSDFLFEKGPISFDEFRKCGIYPFRAFNFIALSRIRGAP